MLFWTSGKTLIEIHSVIANCKCVPIDILEHLNDHAGRNSGADALFCGSLSITSNFFLVINLNEKKILKQKI